MAWRLDGHGKGFELNTVEVRVLERKTEVIKRL
jgi:hypothetical protein